MEKAKNKTPEYQLRASRKYDAANTKMYPMKLNIHKDADIIAKLDSVPSRQGYIKQLIRDDIKKK